MRIAKHTIMPAAGLACLCRLLAAGITCLLPLSLAFGEAASATTSTTATNAAPALTPAPGLVIFAREHPVSFFFRDTEASAALGRVSYEDWKARYSRLAGVMGKMLDEEVIGRSKAQPFYRQFKKDFPDQAVLLHANGTFRKPQADISAYHDGHWLYYNGSRVLDAIPATGDTLTLRVADASLFNKAPYRSNPEMREDVGICALTPDGKPDWNRAEQAMLLDVDPKAGTITVRRGLYGSTPRAFKAGAAYAAAHVAQNWDKANKLWQFNMATTCPRDANGKTASDIWAEELVAAMRPGGVIDFVDGVEFDVPFRSPIKIGRNRAADCDNDGKPDHGIIDGVPVFAIGVDNFFRKLRAALPPGKLIMADIGDKEHRSIGTLNGIETEGWPHLRDPNFKMWSTAHNDHIYWEKFARPPVFTYGLMKFRGFEEVATPNVIRLTIAGPVLVDAAAPMGFVPPAGTTGVWDELLGGALGQRGWLGRALAPARWLALETPDLLVRDGAKKTARAPAGISAPATISNADKTPARAGTLRLAQAGDIVVVVEASSGALPNYPADSYRILSVAIVPTGESIDARTEYPASPVGPVPFAGRFYFRDVPAGDNDILLISEGAAPVRIHSVAAHAAPDLAAREFERGVILANPSHKTRAFDLGKLFPGQNFRRLEATPGQDDKTNNGAPVAGLVTLQGRDALFLLKADSNGKVDTRTAGVFVVSAAPTAPVVRAVGNAVVASKAAGAPKAAKKGDKGGKAQGAKGRAVDFTAFEAREYKKDGLVLPYRILFPENYQPRTETTTAVPVSGYPQSKIQNPKSPKYPLFLFMHGMGRRGTDNKAQLERGAELFLKPENRRQFPCIALYPQAPETGAFVETVVGGRVVAGGFSQLSKNRDGSRAFNVRISPYGNMVMDVIRQLIADGVVDTDRIYIAGSSMGGFATYAFIAQYPDFFAAAAPMAADADMSTVSAWAGKVPVWIVHGADDPTVPPDGARAIAARLKQMGVSNFRYTEYPGIAHPSWDKAFLEPDYMSWFFSHARGGGGKK